MSEQKALKGSMMAEFVKEVRLATFYGELLDGPCVLSMT